MSFTIQDFKDNLSNIVRPNKFLAIVNCPSLISSYQGIGTDEMIFYVQSTMIPDRTFNEIEFKYYGMSYKLPASEIIQDLVISFLCDDKWNVRQYFEQWAQLINNRNDSVKGYSSELFADSSIIIQQLGIDNNVIASYEFFNIFPKIVDQIELNQDTFDTAESFQVTFAYSHWKVKL